MFCINVVITGGDYVRKTVAKQELFRIMRRDLLGFIKKLLVSMLVFTVMFTSSVSVGQAMPHQITDVEDSRNIVKLVSSDKKVEVEVNQSHSVRIMARFNDGEEEDVTELASWEISDPEIARVEEGVIRGLEAGKTSIQVSVHEKTIDIPLKVTPSTTVDDPKVTIKDDGAINITWKTDQNIDFYSIKRKSDKDDRFIEIASHLHLGEYLDEDFIEGETYSYIVLATDKDGNEFSSNEVNIQTFVEQETLEVSDSNISMQPGETRSLKIKSIRKGQNKRDVTESVIWQVSDTEIVEMKDGEIFAKSPGSATVSARYLDQKIEFTVNVEKASADTDYVITLSKGESYQFTNHSTSRKSIGAQTSNGAKYDFATYTKDQKPYEMDIASYGSSVSIPSGGSAVVTVITDSPVTFTAKKENFSANVSNNPALVKTTLYYGESYQFTNTSSSQIEVEKDFLLNGSFDYAVYDVNGNGVDQGLEERPNSIRVPAGGKIVVTGVTDSPSAIGSYYEFFEGIVSDKPALLRVSLNEGESYRFSNKADAQTRVLTNAASSNNIKFDYISYEPDGKTYSKDVGITGEYHHINIPIGGNTVVTNVSEYPILFGGYFEFLDGETSSEQALWRISIAKGENYTITNTSNKNQILVNDSYQDGRMFDYVIKNADGSVKSSRVNYRATRVISLIENKIEIPAGGQLHVTGVEDTPAVIGGESLYFSGETSSNPALLKVIANKGENYQFTNKTHSNINIVSNGLSGSSNPRLFDFAIYNSDKSGKDLKIEASDASLQVPAGGEIVITGASDMPVTVGAPFGFFEVENSTSPALYKREVAANETATFTNINNFDTTIKTDASSGREIDYQTYNESGALVIQRENSTTKSITVPRKGKLIATVSGGGAVNFYGYFNHFLNIDSDGDGIPDWQEVRGIRIGYQGEYIKTVYTDPYNYDTDGDGIYDGAEVLELKYYNTAENFYEVIDDPSSTVNGSIIEDVLFEEPPFYDYESDDLQTIKSILLALEEYKDNLKHYHEDIIEYSESEILSSQTRDQVLDYIFMMDRAALSYLNLSDVLIGKVISQGNLLDWQWVIDNNFESLYLNGTPEMFTTLSNGGANWLAVFGTEVHQRVFEKFRNDSRIKPFGITNQKIPNSNPPRFPDMVYDTSPSGIKYAEIFELKPITWAKFRDPRKYAMAQRQLNDYVTEYHKANPEVTTSTGTIQTWDVVYHFVDIPKYRSAVVLYQFPDQPGMVYYAQFRTDRSNIDKFVVPMKGRKYKTTVNGNVIEVETLAQDNKTGKVVAVAMIGGAVVLVIGTIVEDVFTVGVGTLDDPASFAAAYLLLQNGITILNQD